MLLDLQALARSPRRYEHGSMMLSSNLPFTHWASTLANDQTLTAALLDCLLHHTHVVPISGDSDRLKNKRKAGSLRTPKTPRIWRQGGSVLLRRSRRKVGQDYLGVGNKASVLIPNVLQRHVDVSEPSRSE